MSVRVGLIFQKLESAKNRLTTGGYLRRSPAKFEVTEAMRGRATGRRSVGLTVLEAEKLRSPERVDKGIYGLHLTH